MGLFDSIEEKITGVFSGGGKGNMMSGLMTLINDPQIGGIEGLINTLKEKGLKDAVESWIGTDANQAITGGQLQAALGSAPIQAVAKKLGANPTEAANGLAKLLPEVVDKLSPDGNLPGGEALQKGLSMLKGLGAGTHPPAA